MPGPLHKTSKDLGTTDEAEKMLSGLLVTYPDTSARIDAVKAILNGPMGMLARGKAAHWIVTELTPIEFLVPSTHERWRDPVRDAMTFVITHLSTGRLAPKLVEQIELPRRTRPETRLLRLISRVPGLQKLGQVIARNKHLSPALRRALTQLENNIRDVNAKVINDHLRQSLGANFSRYKVRTRPAILSEASVCAVVRFSWVNPETARREKGVFKIQKPHIPECFAEDMQILQDLAEYFGTTSKYDFASDVIPDTFRKVREHLQHEIDFPGEQAALLEAAEIYRTMSGVRIPKLIELLCSSSITAMSEEPGKRVTIAARTVNNRRRQRMTKRLIQALVAVPLFSSKPLALFHADPHAGNLLSAPRTDDIAIVDWALTGHMDIEQRRYLVLLFVSIALRDRTVALRAIQELTERRSGFSPIAAKKIRVTVNRFFDSLSIAHLPSALDPVTLLEELALDGIRFPSDLVMFSKALFTLDGILADIKAEGFRPELTIASFIVRRWLRDPRKFGAPLAMRDWAVIASSATLYGARLGIEFEEVLLRRFLGRNYVSAAAMPSTVQNAADF